MPAKIIPRARKLGHERFNDRLNQPKSAANITNARNIAIDALFGLIFLVQLEHLKFQGLNVLKKVKEGNRLFAIRTFDFWQFLSLSVNMNHYRELRFG